MSTTSTVAINAGTVEGLWITVSELARQRGVDKAAISRRVSRLEELGALSSRPGPRGSKLINLAEFDKASGETTDAVRQLNGAGASVPPPPPQDPNALVLSEQQARRAAYDADLKKLDLDERLGKVLSIDDVENAAVLIAESLVRKLDQLPTFADEIASAVARDGAQGARGVLRKITFELRAMLAEEMHKLAQSASSADAEVQAQGA